MMGKMLSMGFDLATLPARLTWRSARAMTMTPVEFNHFMAELRQASDEASREVQAVLAGVDSEMNQKAAHLSPQQKQQAAVLALDAAEKHLSMAAVNVLRAVWLQANSNRELNHQKQGVTIEHES